MHQDWSTQRLTALKDRIRGHGVELGFTAVGFAPVELGEAEARLMDWLDRGYHGSMDYMARHGSKRSRPAELMPEVRSVICVRMDYLSTSAAGEVPPERAEIARYARGSDYHKLMRKRLQALAEAIQHETGPYSYRAFCDSAPVMEVELSRLAGLGWRGKHTLLLSRRGSWFFLGELYTDLPLPADVPDAGHCGRCQACLEICPTRAIVAPYRLDARRCISYLTIELAGPIPEEFRAAIGNRIYGCDDCQLTCPWNRFAKASEEVSFLPRQALDEANLVDLFAWEQTAFEDRLAGSPIRRIGHERWLRNLAVALGNAAPSREVRLALERRRDHASALVREHVEWALRRHDHLEKVG